MSLPEPPPPTPPPPRALPFAETNPPSARPAAARVTPPARAQILADRDRFRDQRGQLIDQLDQMRRGASSAARLRAKLCTAALVAE
ncbi:hypothetical protein [Nocardia gipuzkoensis]|uniref:hypothetical protein n=1 Tax=Nocardia gipuzkoensis TaxID=2749991 RepID=UPI0024576530|nr:hypothetical protein [Nocardia gipuzkoensis]